MEKIILKRNYWIIFIICSHILILTSISFLSKNQIINAKSDFITYARKNEPRDWNSKSEHTKYSHTYSKYFFTVTLPKIKSILNNFTTFLFISIIFITVYSFNHLKKHIDKGEDLIFFWILLAVILIAFFYPIIDSGVNLDEDDLEYYEYLMYAHFSFYLIPLYSLIKGEKINIYHEEKQNINAQMDKNMKSLMNLKNNNLINKDELDAKRKEIVKQKIIFDFELSDDYKSLKTLNSNKILTDKEFNEKCAEIIEKKIKFELGL